MAGHHLAAHGGRVSARVTSPPSESPQAISYLSKKPDIGEPFRARALDSQQAAVAQIRDKDAYHGDWQVECRREVGHGHASAAAADDLKVFWLEVRRLDMRHPRSTNHGDDIEPVAGRPRPAAHQHVRP